jgi:fused signal recognition particle receptor
MGDWLYLIIGIAVVGVLTLAGLLTSGRRRGAKASRGVTDVIVPPPTETEVATEAPPEPAVEAAPPAEVATAPTLEKPEGTASRLVRLRSRLSRSQGGLGKGLLALLSRERLDEDTWEAIEDTLLTADIGVAPTQALVEKLRTRLRVEGGHDVDTRAVLREELIELVGTDMDRRLQVTGADGNPGVVLVVGVNGAGKTTTVGKIARILVS